MSGVQARRDEILEKKAKLAAIKAARENRRKDLLGGSELSKSNPSQVISPSPGKSEAERQKFDDYLNSLVGEGSRPGSTGPGTAGSPAGKGSHPGSVLSDGHSDSPGRNIQISQAVSTSTQVLSTVPLSVLYEIPPSPVKEVFSYSKAVQTTEDWGTQTSRPQALSDSDYDERDVKMTSTPNKRLSRRAREREEELRGKIRKEIEVELKAAQDMNADGPLSPNAQSAVTSNFPARALTAEELDAVTSSEDFMDFVERSSKVIERALDQEYDILADYAQNSANGVDDDDDKLGTTKSTKVKEVAQFYDDRWSKKRIISAIDFCPKWPELVLAAYTKNPSAPHDPEGLVQVWNMHMQDRPEFIFHAPSDVLTAKFSPFHPNLIVGGSYSGQVLLWDTRAKSAPVQKTPLTGSGHTHPVYSIDIVGTQNANNIISCSTDGVVCGWTIDMMAQPQERLELTTPPPAKTEDIAPTCMAFPRTDPTYFLIGTEEGTMFPCHRYDRAGAKAGTDQRIAYRGHTAPVMSMNFHPARGPVDLSDLLLTSSLDWSVKLWRIRAPTATQASSITGDLQIVTPIIDFTREDVVYDAAWSPVKPGVFSLVDGAGNLEVWDLTADTEVAITKVQPSVREGGRAMSKSLNKVAWEETEGKRLGVGGLDGVLTIFEVGNGLGGKDNAKKEEWTRVKKLVARVESIAIEEAIYAYAF
ncbi:cytoplasmic dynein-like protein 1 intermediate chain 2 [Calycina marina]|uniref:Cytoplasmic dynein-like protein 1 intermediate chain 2 n=1 Tax=Calycina marina TaxID=1763456 RepID=A0A9P7YXY4_9HELO|nr:cytoplasmic dynein-like protein 1 intermediate chain 2 [Calycina marina]